MEKETVFTFNTDFVEKRGVGFRNEFLAFYLHAVTNVPREVDYKRCAIQAFTPVIDKLFLICKFTYFLYI